MIGNLNQRCTIQQPTRTPDGAGGANETWTTLAVLWAKLEPQSATDSFGPDANESRVRSKLTLRRLASITAGMRAQIGQRVFVIHGVIDSGPQEPLMTLQVEEQP